MSTKLRRINFTAALFLGAALVLSGCKSAPAPGVRNSDGSITNADGSVTYPAGTVPQAAPAPTAKVNPDGSTTNPDGSITYPAGSTRAQAEKQAAPAPQPTQPAPSQAATVPPPAPQQAPPPPPPPVVVRVIPSGAAIPVSLTETLSASRNNAGDRFNGVLARSIKASNGATIFERGTPVTGVVSAAKGKGRFKGAGDLAIELTSIGRTRVSTTEYEAVGKGRGKRTAGIIGGGTGLGAIIGGLAGGGKGALIGGLAGAGAGTAGAAYTGGRDVVIPSESTVTFRLTESVSVR
jgi:hypothetical protein